MNRQGLLAVALTLTFLARGWAGDAWPAFRGAERAGVAEARTLPETWDRERNVVWKVEVPGKGWSSPVVWGDRVYVTSVVSDAPIPESRKGLYILDLNGKVMPGEHRWQVHCLDFATGKTRWTREPFRGKPATPIHIKNSMASETPVTDGERVYAYFGNVGLACYDKEGKELWSHKCPGHRTAMGWGPAASPALDGDRLYVLDDNEEDSTLTALDKYTGKQVWQVRRDEKSNWATPFVWHNDRRTEIVTAGRGKVRSYDTEGKLLWEFSGMSSIAIPTPFARHGLLYVTSGYVADGKRPVFAIRPGGEGNLTLAQGEAEGKFVAWCQKLAGPYNPTPVVYGDYLYVLYDRGVLSCFEARTGKPVYEKQPLGKGATAFTASPWAYGGKVFCLSENGDTFVVEAGPAFKVLGKNGLDEMALASPALANGSLILRTQTRLYRLQQDAPAAGK